MLHFDIAHCRNCTIKFNVQESLSFTRIYGFPSFFNGANYHNCTFIFMLNAQLITGGNTPMDLSMKFLYLQLKKHYDVVSLNPRTTTIPSVLSVED